MSHCYWMTTDEGVTVHINGDFDASQESKNAIAAVVNAVAREFTEPERRVARGESQDGCLLCEEAKVTLTANCDMCRRYGAVAHKTDNYMDHYHDHWHAGHLAKAYGSHSRIARIRRGQPPTVEEWE